jgi:very-short-patch-repair endonuclease
MKAFQVLRRTADVPEFDAFGVEPEAIRSFNLSMGDWIMGDAHGFWLEGGSDGHSDPERFVATIGQRMSQLCTLYNVSSPQSPIEAQLGAALLWICQDWAGFPDVDYYGGPQENIDTFGPFSELKFFLTPQASVGAYRVDFLLWFGLGKHFGGVAIECDGHAFHEKTKEQASRDKFRDRSILAAGFPTMRFSGSEIFRGAIKCCDQVSEVLSPILGRVSKEGGLLS